MNEKHHTPASAKNSMSIDVDVELLASAVDSVKDSIIITDTQLDEPGPRIIYVNPAFTEMTGYTAQDVIGKSPRFLQGPKTDRRVLDDIRSKLASNQSFEGKAVNYRKDGSTFINEWRIKPIVLNGSSETYFVAIQRDVTEREKITQALEDKNRVLSELLQQKDRVVSELLQQIEREKLKNKEIET